jgi:hypothetical protein
MPGATGLRRFGQIMDPFLITSAVLVQAVGAPPGCCSGDNPGGENQMNRTGSRLPLPGPAAPDR